MTKSVRYQDGQLYVHHGAWFVRYRVRVRQEDGLTKLQQKAKKLGSVADYPLESQIMPLKTDFMHRLNAGKFTPESGMVLKEFVEKVYLPYIEELRESTKKGYWEIWNNHIRDRVGHIRMREFRTVDASKMLKAVADKNELTKTTLQHIKSVLSGIFTHAKNVGAFDGVNPVQDARIPRNAREPGETYAYNLTQIRCILEILPLLPKAVVATASFAGLREGELRGLEWPDYTRESLSVNRSIWKTFVNKPKTRASAKAVPVIRQLAEILNAYRVSMGNPSTGVIFHSGDGKPMDLDKLAQQVIRPLVKSIGLEWYGWHGFRRGIASNLYELGADEKVVQRILRHAKSHVTKDRYIKAFDPAVLAAMRKLETSLDAISQSAPIVHQIN
ncbi:MAG TPA: tyrosine-type recombinase/integrase [Candidatus Acidoferrales bacterium]|jgi:integrase|nr:tyrosine-type recombinase/integrase [Candidatus Acidoferrales bacterium]